MTETSHDIRTLNGLIATTIDSVDGYRSSAEAVDSPRYGELFTARASERSSVAEQLRAEVRRLGGNPEDDGTLLAGGHRAFLNLKAAVTTRDDQASSPKSSAAKTISRPNMRLRSPTKRFRPKPAA